MEGFLHRGRMTSLTPQEMQALQTQPLLGSSARSAAAQAGLLGLGFAPGAGMADYLGQFPAPGGGTEPSAMQNFRQGNYGTAAMQLLGAGGDMMYAMPLLGATVGSALKAPRAAQRARRALQTDQDKAMEVAQRNAALPVEQGGLGLHPNNTPMDRARAMGFDVDTPTYHGTNADITAFDTRGKGKTTGAGAFFTDNPVVAETYVGTGGGGNIMPVVLRQDGVMDLNARGMNWNDLDTNRLSYRRKPVYSLFDELDPNSVTSTDELSMLARDAGFPGMSLKNVRDVGPNSHNFRMKEYVKDKFGVEINDFSDWDKLTGKQFAEARDAVERLYKTQKSTVTSLQDPANIRSRFAAFDPMKRNLPDLLAGIGAGGIGLGLLMSPETERRY